MSQAYLIRTALRDVRSNLGLHSFIRAIAFSVLNAVQVLHITNLFFIGFNLGCAFAPDTGSLIGLRFLGEFLCELVAVSKT
jgi:hypothetical protein